MASTLRRGLFALIGLLAVGFGVHYALFGTLPLGKPELLRDDVDAADAADTADTEP
ncbi:MULTISPECIES: hypothetical protein [Halorussus]|uniref:hypothetical protein n=1 Tax=Halorussus TaxID=1070314 RepID=UPI001404E8B4|nr:MULTISPECIES: hypothetical protein [Halorussus]NHN61446.1 hypothetical protein [Halorussus sp. JP-T4]